MAPGMLFSKPGPCSIGAPDFLVSRRHVMNDRERKNLVGEATQYVAHTIRGVGDVAGAIVDATSNVLVHALSNTRATGSELRALIADTVTGTLHGVAQVGGEVESAAGSI